MRDAKDRGVNWMLAHHADSLLRLNGVMGFSRWRSAQTKLSHPLQLPDGLLELTFPDRPQLVPYLVEVEMYPDREAEEQILRDLAIVLLEKRVVSDVLVVVLQPKGQYRLPDQQTHRSALGSTEVTCKWRVLELWTLPATTLLAAGDVGLLPWVPLTQLDAPPEVVFQQCRDRIDREADPKEHANLLAVSQVFAQVRYNDQRLLHMLGGRKMLLESPLLKDIYEEKERNAHQADIVAVLEERFKVVPADLIELIRAIQNDQRLNKFVRRAVSCADLEAFRQELTSSVN